MNVGPDDFGGSDFDSGFETGWDRMMREHAQEEARRRAFDHPRYDEAFRLAREHGHEVDWIVAQLRDWDAEAAALPSAPCAVPDVVDLVRALPEGGLVVMAGARIGG
jgi:hypothetical protein